MGVGSESYVHGDKMSKVLAPGADGVFNMPLFI
jgi:hypothetical protein